ncbi:MAG TPA: zinc metalloprotease [Thermoleophilaceae bacterium]|nr:zinc metalloprotease [Thermoleophilaceae bacterium]
MATPRRRTCAHVAVHELLVETDPGYRDRRLKIHEETQRIIASGEAMRVARRVTTVQVVVHVVYRTKQENISDAQVRSQVAALNRDYGLKNTDKSKVPQPFKSIVGNPNVQFKLATRDPDGKQTNGITRTATTVDGFSSDNGVKSAKTGGRDPWDTARYLNLWVCALGQGLLGYAQFPGGPAATDGVVLLNTAFGTRGTAAAPFNKGRTATHEVGHFLNLRHIWGDMNDCTGNDQVADTPKAEGANFGKPSFPHISCHNGPNGDMFMNYMDYVDDAAMVMFSQGQVARMNATLAGPRKSLVS